MMAFLVHFQWPTIKSEICAAKVPLLSSPDNIRTHFAKSPLFIREHQTKVQSLRRLEETKVGNQTKIDKIGV